MVNRVHHPINNRRVNGTRPIEKHPVNNTHPRVTTNNGRPYHQTVNLRHDNGLSPRDSNNTIFPSPLKIHNPRLVTALHVRGRKDNCQRKRTVGTVFLRPMRNANRHLYSTKQTIGVLSKKQKGTRRRPRSNRVTDVRRHRRVIKYPRPPVQDRKNCHRPFRRRVNMARFNRVERRLLHRRDGIVEATVNMTTPSTDKCAMSVRQRRTTQRGLINLPQMTTHLRGRSNVAKKLLSNSHREINSIRNLSIWQCCVVLVQRVYHNELTNTFPCTLARQLRKINAPVPSVRVTCRQRHHNIQYPRTRRVTLTQRHVTSRPTMAILTISNDGAHRNILRRHCVSMRFRKLRLLYLLLPLCFAGCSHGERNFLYVLLGIFCQVVFRFMVFSDF